MRWSCFDTMEDFSWRMVRQNRFPNFFWKLALRFCDKLNGYKGEY